MSHLTSPSTRRRGLPLAGTVLAASALTALTPAGALAADGTSVLRADQQQQSRSTPQIVGGDVAGIASAPYQVRIRAKTDGRAWGTSGAFTSCGGSVLNATTIVTAAHCTIDSADNGNIDPESYVVDTGFSRFDATPGAGTDPAPQQGDTLQTKSVSAVRRHAGYGRPLGGSGSLAQLADDVAVLTLSTPLTFDANTQPIVIADPGPAPSSGDARVTGFGLQAANGDANGTFYSLPTPVVDPSVSQQNGGAGELNALYVVTLAARGSTCQGDSGGPLVQNGRLIGIVSSGPTCGPNTPSYFTNVSAPEVRDFILGNDTPPVAPRGGQDVTLRIPSSPKVNDVATCSAGTWSNGPTYTYRFTDTKSGRILAESASATYKLVAADAGATISCRAIATTPGGVGVTPPTAAASAVAALPKPDPARLSAAITSGSSRVKQGSRVSFRITVRNTGDVTARTVRTCVRVSSRFSIVSRGGATLSGGRLCWTNSRLATTTTKRFSLRADRDARTGRTTAATVSVTSPSVRSASARRAVTITRRAAAAAPNPGGVTG